MMKINDIFNSEHRQQENNPQSKQNSLTKFDCDHWVISDTKKCAFITELYMNVISLALQTVQKNIFCCCVNVANVISLLLMFCLQAVILHWTQTSLQQPMSPRTDESLKSVIIFSISLQYETCSDWLSNATHA